MAEEDLQALRRIYDAFSRWDVDELARDVTHDFELEMPDSLPFGGTRHGYDGVQAFASVFREHVDGPWADPDDFLDAGDRVVVLGRMLGEGKQTGQAFRAPFAAVWTFSDGVASRFQVYMDTAQIVAALEGSEAADRG